MSKINTFLQKRKMQESRHGIIMVVLAYVLSILMLFLGSDVFYNIKSTAAGIKNETDEVTEELMKEGELRDDLAELREKKLQAHYQYSQTQDSSEEDTVWLLGRAMNAKEYEALFEQLDSYQTEFTKEQNGKQDASLLIAQETSVNVSKVSNNKADSETEDADGSIQSFSIKETRANVSDETVKTTETKEVIEASVKEDKTKDTKKKTQKDDAKETSSSKYLYDVTAEEIEMLERIVQAEAGSEDIKGRILVANVVLNRVADDDFPDTIKEVIFQNSKGEYQFSPVSDKRFWSVKVSKKTKEAVQRALEGEDHSEGALYFMARKRARTSSAKWFDNNLTWLFKHGGHEFYK